MANQKAGRQGFSAVGSAGRVLGRQTAIGPHSDNPVSQDLAIRKLADSEFLLFTISLSQLPELFERPLW
jgi:hypothetical protein